MNFYKRKNFKRISFDLFYFLLLLAFNLSLLFVKGSLIIFLLIESFLTHRVELLFIGCSTSFIMIFCSSLSVLTLFEVLRRTAFKRTFTPIPELTDDKVQSFNTFIFLCQGLFYSFFILNKFLFMLDFKLLNFLFIKHLNLFHLLLCKLILLSMRRF